MTSSGTGPPTFAESMKFDGSNWVTWSGLIKIAADLCGAFGYLDGSIKNPNPTGTPTSASPQNVPLPLSPMITTAATTTSTVPTLTTTETPWESTIPSAAEWKVRNAWALGLLIFNTNDPVGLGISIQGTAADAWKSYVETYQIASKVAIINADTDLRNMKYTDNHDFKEFISQIRTKWANATALGASIDNRLFRTIVLAALPRSWDSIVATLYNTVSS
jgi:hypothetical protein